MEIGSYLMLKIEYKATDGVHNRCGNIWSSKCDLPDEERIVVNINGLEADNYPYAYFKFKFRLVTSDGSGTDM